MKILSCHIENFGALSDFRLRFEDGLTLLMEENGWGKTTLAAFLTAMFYGFPAGGRKGGAGERSRCMPWRGGVCGGDALFEEKGRVYRIVRTFGATPKEDTFRLYDERTGYESEDFSNRPGEDLFGIDRASFLQTALFEAGAPILRAGAPVQARISGLSSETDDLPAYDSAMNRLRLKERRLSPTLASGALSRLSREMELLEREAAGAGAAGKEVEEAAEALRREREALRQLRSREQAVLQQAAVTAAEPTAVPEDPALRNALNKIKKKQRRIRNKAADTADLLENRKKLAAVLAAAGFLAGVPGLFLFFARSSTGSLLPVLLVSAAILLEAGAAAAFYSCRQLSSLLLSLEDEDEELTGRKRRLLRKLKTDARSASVPAPDMQVQAKLESLSQEIDLANTQIQSLRVQLEEARERLRACEQAAARREALLTEYESLQEEYLVCTQTARFLEQAHETFAVRCMDPFRRAFLKYYCAVADIRPEEIRTDASLGVALQIEGLPRDPSVLSSGSRDLLGFCRRMAILEAMYPENRPFLILDDPLSGLDDIHLAAALRIVRESSRSWQILYLTCHSSRLP